MIDLHIHTNCSDGDYSPKEILNRVVEAGCNFFSVADHDNMDANEIILGELKKRKSGVKFMTGVEMSSALEDKFLHLLCYNFDYTNEPIRKMMLKAAVLRKERVISLFTHLEKKHNIIIPLCDREEILKKDIAGKPHIAKAAIKRGLTTLSEIDFAKKMLRVEDKKSIIDARDVIAFAHEAGAFVSYAHPILTQDNYGLDYEQLDAYTKKLKDLGVDAIEVFHSLHNEEQVEKYGAMAQRYGLKITCGSDFHSDKGDRKIGRVTKYGFVAGEKDIKL